MNRIIGAIKILFFYLCLAAPYMVYNKLYRGVDCDELLSEQIKMSDGSYVYAFHSSVCPRKCWDYANEKYRKHWWLSIDKWAFFVKRKYYVYDTCIDSAFAEVLDDVSRMNCGYQNVPYDSTDRWYWVQNSVGKHDTIYDLPRKIFVRQLFEKKQ